MFIAIASPRLAAEFSAMGAALAALASYDASDGRPAVYEVEIEDLNKARDYGAGQGDAPRWRVRIKDSGGFTIGYLAE